jgi:hypothetical protein
MSEIRNMTITLHLQNIHLSVPLSDSDLPIKIRWIRGKQTVDSKVRLIRVGAATTNVSEKFQLTTSVEFDRATGIPNKEKLVR